MRQGERTQSRKAMWKPQWPQTIWTYFLCRRDWYFLNFSHMHANWIDVFLVLGFFCCSDMPQELFIQYFYVTEAGFFSLNNPIVKGNSKIPTINGNIISHKFISIKGNTLKIKQCNKIATRYFCLLKAETCYGCVSSPIIFLLPKVIPALPIVCVP